MSKAIIDDPINTRLKRAKNFTLGDLKIRPRQYQTELCNKALQQNVIIYLGTGLGKTFITVLYLNAPQIAEQIHDGRKVVFMAPTQDLIKQQAEYINMQTPYKVKIFCGRSAHCGEQTDHWDRAVWAQEAAKVDILCMTPQIFAAAISTNILDWSQFGTIIFDEAHHACRSKKKPSKHAYAQILGHYGSYFKINSHLTTRERPRMIALTASLINNMPKDRSSITNEVRYLEGILHATCVTDIDVQDKRPQMVTISYNSGQPSVRSDCLTSILEDLRVKMNLALKINESKELLRRPKSYLTPSEIKTLAFFNRLKLATFGLSIKPANFAKVIEGLIGIRQRCGLWSMKAICQRLVDAFNRPHLLDALSPDIRSLYNDFSEILKLVHASIESFLGNDIQRQLLTYTRPKVKALLKTLEEEYQSVKDGSSQKSSFSCIIFVRSRLEVVALDLLIQRIATELSQYQFLKCDYALGLAATQTSRYSCITKRKAADQHNMLKQFREGERNVIITTSVLEEGIDLPVCSTVIRYDEVRNFREFVQSRGRARQEKSSFIHLCELHDVLKNEDKLDKFHDFELVLKDSLTASNIGPSVCASESSRKPPFVIHEEDDEDFFLAKGGSVRITSVTARTIINMYCNQLAKNTPFLEGVTYSKTKPSSDTHQVTIYLPSGCPLAGGITGREKSDAYLAENSAVVAAVKALYESNELDEHGVPTRCTETNLDQILANIGLAPNFDPLERELEGIQEDDGYRVVNYFPMKSNQPENYLFKSYQSRSYKLIKIRYVAQPNSARAETLRFFEKCTFGLVVDSGTDTEFVPPKLHSHYGVFQVDFQVIDNFRIQRREDHVEYLHYTLKLLERCLSLGPIKSQEFQYKCLCYILPLDETGQPDKYKMQTSFQAPPTHELKSNDIVRFSRYYQDNRQGRGNNRLMLVKRIRNDLNANSYVPGRRRETLLETAEFNYGRGVVRNINQPVIEVVPLSSDFAALKVGKQIRQDYTTQTLFYLAQFLERFDDDPACVFQAFNKPVIIHELYRMNAVSEFDKKFIADTSERRLETLEKFPDASDTSGQVDDEPLVSGIIDAEATGGDYQSEIKERSSGEDEESDYDDEEDEEAGDEDIDEDRCESDSDTSDEELIDPNYVHLVNKKSLNLNDHGDDDYKSKHWNLSEYKVDNLAKCDYKRQDYFEQEVAIEDDPKYVENISQISPKIQLISQRLLENLRAVELKMTSDSSFLNEEEEFKKRTAVVDKSIIPPIKFDENTSPIRRGTREKALLEGLTLRRAASDFNLEGLENIGDSNLKYLISIVLFKLIDGNEGMLSSARSRLVSNRHFTHLAKKKRLGRYAITKPFSKDQIAHTLGRPLRSDADPKDFLNRMRPKDLADCFESLVGSYLVHWGQFEALLMIDWLGLNVLSKSSLLFERVHEKAVVFSRAPSALLVDTIESREYLQMLKKKVSAFEGVIGYKFNDASYLVQAFTHATSSVKCTRSYERLEFIGDAILDYLVTMVLAGTSIANDPGQLTSSRSALVNNYAFAKLALIYKYDLFIQHSNLELYDELTKVRLAMEDDPDLSFVSMNTFDKVVKLLGDVFESVAGAIYLDSGMSLDSVWAVYYPMMMNSIEQELKVPTKNATAALYEMFPGRDRVTFESYDHKTADGDLIGVRCKVAGFGEFEGSGITKRQAKLRAVEEALRNPPSKERLDKLNKDFLDSERIAGRGKPQRPTRGGGRGRGKGGRRGVGGPRFARSDRR